MKEFFKIFEWNTATDFLNSLIPSIKLQVTVPLLSLGSVMGLISAIMGVQADTVFAICVALFAELISGIYASVKRGDRIRSGKFGRFVVKACVWLMCVYIVNAFCKEFAANKSEVMDVLMKWVRSAFLMTCFLEYMISINENMESITGRKSIFIRLLKEKINFFITGKDTKDKDSDADKTTL